MIERKFQVFISSTYDDLVNERKAVEETIIRSGDFPVGMEAFPAADEEQFEFIKTIIDRCDYYILIIGGRYGSIASDGLSYTEKEYIYAVDKGIPVLVLLRDDLGSLPAKNSEASVAGRENLTRFIEETSKGRIRKTWSTTDGLKLAVREALDHAKATKPRYGWIRGDNEAGSEILSELNDLRKELEVLRKSETESRPRFDDLAELETVIEVRGSRKVDHGQRGGISEVSWNTNMKLSDIFGLIAPNLIECPLDSSMSNIMAVRICEALDKSGGYSHKIENHIFDTIKIQFEAHKLIKVERSQTVGGGFGVFWFITNRGKDKMLDLRVIRKNSEPL